MKKFKRISNEEIEVTDESGSVKITPDDIKKMTAMFEKCWDCETCEYLHTCDRDPYEEGYEKGKLVVLEKEDEDEQIPDWRFCEADGRCSRCSRKITCSESPFYMDEEMF